MVHTPDDRRPIVYVVSDSLGDTAESVARAAISQFNKGTAAEVRRIPYVDSVDAVREIVARARRPCMFVFTLIRPELRALLSQEAAAAGIPAVDVMGPTMDALHEVIDSEPRLEPGLVHRLDEQYFRRIEAIEFTVRCDDGKDLRSLPKADVVLIGVSRTSKTPVSMYLAHRQLKVANVPLVPELDPPPELFQVAPGKVIGLTIQWQKLVEIRRERIRSIGLPQSASYGTPERVQEELDYARKIFIKLQCSVIDVTNKAVEETASQVVQILAKGEFEVGGA